MCYKKILMFIRIQIYYLYFVNDSYNNQADEADRKLTLLCLHPNHFTVNKEKTSTRLLTFLTKILFLHQWDNDCQRVVPDQLVPNGTKLIRQHPLAIGAYQSSANCT